MKHTHRLSKRLEPPSGAAIETFSDLLADARDLEDICMTALQFSLETLGRKAGVLAAQTLADKEPACIVQINLPENWSEQLTDSASPLRCVAQDILETGHYLLNEGTDNRPSLDSLAAAVPIPTRSGAQGVLLLYGMPCSPVEVDWLLKLSRPIGRAIRMRRTNSVKSARSQARQDSREIWNILHRTATNMEAEKVQRQLLQGVRQIVGAEQCVLALLAGDGGGQITRKVLDDRLGWIDTASMSVEAIAQTGLDVSGNTVRDVPAASYGLLRECLQNQAALFVNDLAADPRFDPHLDSLPGFQARSLLVVPLLVEGHVLGAVQALNKRRGEFDRADQDAVTVVADLAAHAIYDRHLLKQYSSVVDNHVSDQNELLNTRSMFNALLENLPGCVYIIDREYGLIALNASTAQRIGQETVSLTGKVCYQALYQRSEACPDCLVAESLRKGKETLRSATRFQRSSADSTSTWEVRSYPILDCDDQIVQAILFEQDITDRRELEAALAQSGKLAALGQLAAGVAHEINNPLTAIIANAQILQRDLPPGDERLESVDLIALAGSRAAQVVRNLLDFARKEQVQRVRTNVNETLRSTLAMVQHELISRGVTLHFAPEESLPVVMAAPDSLQGVWLNLLLNAIESVEKNQGVILVKTWRLKDEVRVSVADNGRGIPAERLERIFEPFYTTKGPGRGTGLGLSLCRQVIEQHNGRISVNSQVGRGSEFIVALPIA